MPARTPWPMDTMDPMDTMHSTPVGEPSTFEPATFPPSNLQRPTHPAPIRPRRFHLVRPIIRDRPLDTMVASEYHSQRNLCWLLCGWVRRRSLSSLSQGPPLLSGKGRCHPFPIFLPWLNPCFRFAGSTFACSHPQTFDLAPSRVGNLPHSNLSHSTPSRCRTPTVVAIDRARHAIVGPFSNGPYARPTVRPYRGRTQRSAPTFGPSAVGRGTFNP
jgi:hypothetical protein